MDIHIQAPATEHEVTCISLTFIVDGCQRREFLAKNELSGSKTNSGWLENGNRVEENIYPDRVIFPLQFAAMLLL